LIAGRALWFYVGKLVWPHPLVFFYPRWVIDSRQWWQYLFPLGAVAMLLGLWLARERMGRGPLAAVLIFAGVLFPVLGFFDVFAFRYSFVADHFQYHASIALIALGAATVALLAEFLGRLWLVPIAIAVLTPLSIASHIQTYAYEHRQSLWEDVLSKNQESWAAHNNLGKLLREAGRYEAAIGHFRTALELHPGHFNALYNWARALADMGDTHAAIEKMREAISAKPGLAQPHHELGLLFQSIQMPRSAVQSLAEAVALEPSNLRYNIDFASALVAADELPQAQKHLERAIVEFPNSADAHNLLGVTLTKVGQFDRAIAELQIALKLSKYDAAVLGNLQMARDAKEHAEGGR